MSGDVCALLDADGDNIYYNKKENAILFQLLFFFCFCTW